MILPQKLSNSLGVRNRYELFPMIQKKCILFCLQNGFLQSVCRIFFCIKSRLSRSDFCPVWWSPFAAVSRQGKNGTSLPCSRSSLLCVVFRSPPLPLCSRQFLQEEKTSRSQAALARLAVAVVVVSGCRDRLTIWNATESEHGWYSFTSRKMFFSPCTPGRSDLRITAAQGDILSVIAPLVTSLHTPENKKGMEQRTNGTNFSYIYIAYIFCHYPLLFLILFFL